MVAQIQKKKESEGKQFRLVKFFAWASFIILVIFSFPFSMVISQNAKKILLRSYENYALLVGENLNHQVVQNFMIPVILGGGQVSLRDEQQYNWMDQIVRNTIHGFNVEVVNMYDIGKGVIAYTTDSRLYGKKVKLSLGYKKALKGENSSLLIAGGHDLWGLGIESTKGEWKLRTLMPMSGINPFTGERGVNPFTGERGEIIGVLELLQDLTREYRSIVKFQYLTFGLTLLIMGLIFFALLVIVHKAERVIDQRARERRELEEQLNQAERLAALGEMVAGISHEVKNPLGIIQSTAELLGEMPDANDTQRRLSGVITEESERLNRIVTEFLDFARPQAPNLQECQLEEIINKNISFIRPELEKMGIMLEHNLNGRSLKLRADHDLLYRALLNIFLNAIQSMKQGGTIHLKVEENRDDYQIEIQDSGCGISEDNFKKIFNPFFTTKEKGTGLGLSIVKKIIEGHKGTIALESREEEGTKVRIHLPRRG